MRNGEAEQRSGFQLEPSESRSSYYANRPVLAQRIRHWSFGVAMVTNFIGVPLAAVLIYQIKGYSWLAIVAGTILALTAVMFGFWFCLEYYRDRTVD